MNTNPELNFSTVSLIYDGTTTWQLKHKHGQNEWPDKHISPIKSSVESGRISHSSHVIWTLKQVCVGFFS
ncbi:hypothetical protein Y032_0115g485 [Ancylostoma ceylanicum]|uniref:Uncharacterized protein n=1 Tax=Ancylostoma ceylanicum TaxID=53326 RepID=A0A016TCR5_9BILA|nr:hypothetical protein Y032_0115g485 [Ancylostoma ceylanicum]